MTTAGWMGRKTKRIADERAETDDGAAGSVTSERSAHGGIHWGGASCAGHREGGNDSFRWVKERSQERVDVSRERGDVRRERGRKPGRRETQDGRRCPRRLIYPSLPPARKEAAQGMKSLPSTGLPLPGFHLPSPRLLASYSFTTHTFTVAVTSA